VQIIGEPTKAKERVKMIKILYAGDYALITHTYVKGMNSWTSGQAFDERHFVMDVLDSIDGFKAEYLPTPYVSERFPSTLEEMQQYDVIIISDVGTDTILMYPDIFKIPMGENRLELLSQYVNGGGGLMAVGGWMSFGGQMGQAKYHGTKLEEILGINASPYDDRVEVPEGLTYNPIKKDHPLIKGLDWDKSPLLFLGYNRFTAKNPDNIIAEWNGDPMMVVNNYGKGRTLSFASDIAPHWGQGFVEWENNHKFWEKTLKYLANK
jgi:uncharacterized membrane protein